MSRRPSVLATALSAALAALLFAALLGGCATRLPRATLQAGTQAIEAEVARSEAERERGLMGRKSLGPREGMIFVFDRDERLSFWMKNTPLPLSIAFISVEGRVTQIEDMDPYSERIIRSRLSVRYALEMRQGAFAELGVAEGDTVRFPEGFPEKL
jgi:uncharacterized membrane protein (UPF0127 family)